MFTPVSHGSIHHQLFFNVPWCWCPPRFLPFRMIPGFHMVAFGLWVHVSTWGVSHGPSIPVVMRVMHVSQPLINSNHFKGYLSSNLCINPHVLPMKLPCSLVISNVFTKTKLFFSMKALIFACFPSFSLVRSQFWCELPHLDDHPTW